MCASQIIKSAILKYWLFFQSISPKGRFYRYAIRKIYFWHRKSISRPKNSAIRHQDHQNRIRNGKISLWEKYAKSDEKGHFWHFYPFLNFGIFYPILMILVSNFIRIGSGSRFLVSKIESFDHVTKQSPFVWESWEKRQIFQNCGFYDLTDTHSTYL